ncbi:uroporphyrinogen decarboxylase family protein, partial [Chloroflexota bacterium]
SQANDGGGITDMDNEAQNNLARVRRVFNEFLKSERPWVEVIAQMHDHAMVLEGVSIRDIYWNAETFITSVYEAAAYYQIDMPSANADNYNFEIEALGAKMIYSDIAMPTVDHREPFIKGPEDLVKIKTPDFYHDARMPYTLEATKLSTQFGNKTGWFCGPFSLLVGMMGYVNLIKSMRKQPEFTRELFELVIDKVLIPYIKVQKEYCGITVAFGADAWANTPNLSLAQMEEWVVPFNQKLIAKGKETGLGVSIGSGYYYEERSEKFDNNLLLKSFPHQFASRDGAISLRLNPGDMLDYPFQVVREYTAQYREQGITPIIQLTVDARLLRDAPVERVTNQIKQVIDLFARDHNLGILLGNIPSDTNPDHVHAAIAAVHTFGRKPIADNLDDIEFQLPRRESFEEWKRSHK